MYTRLISAMRTYYVFVLVIFPCVECALCDISRGPYLQDVAVYQSYGHQYQGFFSLCNLKRNPDTMQFEVHSHELMSLIEENSFLYDPRSGYFEFICKHSMKFTFFLTKTQLNATVEILVMKSKKLTLDKDLHLTNIDPLSFTDLFPDVENLLQKGVYQVKVVTDGNVFVRFPYSARNKLIDKKIVTSVAQLKRVLHSTFIVPWCKQIETMTQFGNLSEWQLEAFVWLPWYPLENSVNVFWERAHSNDCVIESASVNFTFIPLTDRFRFQHLPNFTTSARFSGRFSFQPRFILKNPIEIINKHIYHQFPNEHIGFGFVKDQLRIYFYPELNSTQLLFMRNGEINHEFFNCFSSSDCSNKAAALYIKIKDKATCFYPIAFEIEPQSRWKQLAWVTLVLNNTGCILGTTIHTVKQIFPLKKKMFYSVLSETPIDFPLLTKIILQKIQVYGLLQVEIKWANGFVKVTPPFGLNAIYTRRNLTIAITIKGPTHLILMALSTLKFITNCRHEIGISIYFYTLQGSSPNLFHETQLIATSQSESRMFSLDTPLEYHISGRSNSSLRDFVFVPNYDLNLNLLFIYEAFGNSKFVDSTTESPYRRGHHKGTSSTLRTFLPNVFIIPINCLGKAKGPSNLVLKGTLNFTVLVEDLQLKRTVQLSIHCFYP